jgi:hypothetical protein
MVGFRPVLALALTLLLPISPSFAADLPKPHVPDEPTQAKAEATIKQIFKAEYASNDSPARRAFARKLLGQARDEKTESASRFVLFREARNMAASAGDVVTALRAVDEMSKVFAIDPSAYKLPVIQSAGRGIDNQEDAAIFISAGIALVDQMTAARDFAGANKLLAPLAMVAGQMKNPLIISGVRKKVQNLKDTQVEYERLKALMNKPGGELAAGKYACFFDNDWEQGLARLAKSGDAKIKDAAASDIAGAKTGAERMAIANAWWETAQSKPRLKSQSSRPARDIGIGRLCRMRVAWSACRPRSGSPHRWARPRMRYCSRVTHTCTKMLRRCGTRQS